MKEYDYDVWMTVRVKFTRTAYLETEQIEEEAEWELRHGNIEDCKVDEVDIV